MLMKDQPLQGLDQKLQNKGSLSLYYAKKTIFEKNNNQQ